jgi:glycosyltransferase involved in cell wall biosynthesis
MRHHHKQPRVLFVLKLRSSGPYGSWGYSESGSPLPSGMSVSVKQMIKALEELGIEAKLVQVQDNNFIHQEVVAYDPTHVIIEGFWVVPDKFKILAAMNPDIEWMVRCHSNTEFLAHEGTVFGWALDYLERDITVGFNSPTAEREIKELVRDSSIPRPGRIVYLPNYYDFNTHLNLPREWLQRLVIKHSKVKNHGEFHVGCFGAIRPLKNNMNQALAAIKVASRLGLKLKFYVNANRVENQGDALLRSLRSLFERVKPHELVEVPWMDHKDFMELLTTMDIVSQVSNSETFNIVLADSVVCDVPVIGANIPWLDEGYQADPNDVTDIANVMHHTWIKAGNDSVQQRQKRTLIQYVKRSAELWERYLQANGNC